VVVVRLVQQRGRLRRVELDGEDVVGRVAHGVLAEEAKVEPGACSGEHLRCRHDERKAGASAPADSHDLEHEGRAEGDDGVAAEHPHW